MKLTNRVDYFGADISELQNKKLFLFDMDGTIYEEDRLFEGTLELLDYIQILAVSIFLLQTIHLSLLLTMLKKLTD
ncbi:phosphotransferase [Streptococcus pneumoniae]|nr:phosphotransferase [Streptococcus pneumoniae]